MRVRFSLILKFIIAISLILIAFMGIMDNMNLKKFRKVTIDYAEFNAEQIADVISQCAFDTMLKNDKESLYQMIERIAQNKNIEHVRLVDNKSRVVFSNRKEEIGSVIGKHDGECSMCHFSERFGMPVKVGGRSRIIKTKDGKEALGFTRVIYNQPACVTAACHFHTISDNVLGLMDISISLEALSGKSREYRLEFIVLTCLLLIMTGMLITILLHTMVDKTVQRLVHHSSLVARGQLNSRVSVTSSDELGELSESFNRMTENLEKADLQLKGWADSLENKVEERSREILHMQEQLRRSEKLASLGTLAAGVAHEINNPLTGILLYASIVSEDKRLHPELAEDMERILSETRRCAVIIKNLLDFSRESAPEKQLISVNYILDTVIELFHKQPGFKDILISRQYGEDVPSVTVDPNQIRQVFFNLIINAGHAMEHGGDLKISTFLSAEDSAVCVVISDSGCGIPEDQLGKIFDPFFTTKSEGTGLGLSISYGIVENNGGKIKVSSTVGVGTTFTVLLPLS